jgi:glutamate-1-semialdehyde 2,1-aminomutase
MIDFKNLIKTKNIDIASFNCPSKEVLKKRKAALARLKCSGNDSLRDASQDISFAENYRVPFPFTAEMAKTIPYNIFKTEKDCDAFSSYGVKVFDENLYKECLTYASKKINEDGFYLNEFHPVVESNVNFLKKISGMDNVSFHMSGTEALMHAIRLAKFNTGKSNVVKFKDAYHGWCLPDNIKQIKKPEDLLKIKDCAAVLVNPLSGLYDSNTIKTDALLFTGFKSDDYNKASEIKKYKKIREICNRKGIVFILDEVFLGFRVALGGCQEFFGIHADIVTYGKTIAGGFPIGIVCGKDKFTKKYSKEYPLKFLGNKGTFSAHPMGMHAMHYFINKISEDDYSEKEGLWNTRIKQLNLEILQSGFQFKNLHSVIAIKECSNSNHNWMLQFYLQKNGVKLGPYGSSRFIFRVNLTDEEWLIFTEKLIFSLSEMKLDGWLDTKFNKWRSIWKYVIC